MRTNRLTFALAFAGIVGCGINVNVKKEPRQVDSTLEASHEDSSGWSALDASSDNYLKSIDDLRTYAAAQVIKELSKGDYRQRFRDGFRFYRAGLIEKSSHPIADKTLSFSGSDQCRDFKIDLNIEKADQYIGMIMQAGLLATLSQGGFKTLNSGQEKEMAAVAEIILKDLGVELKGTSDVVNADGKTTMTADFSLKLVSDPNDDAATQEKDAAEVLKMKFARVVGDKNIGTFKADIALGHKKDDASTENLALHMEVERKLTDGLFVQSARVTLGIAGGDPYYAHSVEFSEIEKGSHTIRISEVYRVDAKTEKTVVTTYDVDSHKQCRESQDAQDVPSKDPVTPTPTPTPTSSVTDPTKPDAGGTPVQTPGQTSKSPSQTK